MEAIICLVPKIQSEMQRGCGMQLFEKTQYVFTLVGHSELIACLNQHDHMNVGSVGNILLGQPDVLITTNVAASSALKRYHSIKH